MWTASRISITSLKVIGLDKAQQPLRWIRYITHANSYVVRI
jgi:hypothetical protein